MATEEVLDIDEMDLECLGPVGVYAKKYFVLRKKCEQIQQSNEKLVNRLYHVKRMIKKYRKEKRLFVNKLEEHGDNFRDAEVQPLWEDPPSTTTATTLHPASTSPNDQNIKPLSVVTTNCAALTVVGAATHDSSCISPEGNTKVKVKGRGPDKSDRDGNAPKKPINAFLRFCQHQRPLIQEQYRKEESGEISHPELTRRLASQWNALPAEKKDVYYELYEQERQRYEQQLEVFSAKPMPPEATPPPPPAPVLTTIKAEPL